MNTKEGWKGMSIEMQSEVISDAMRFVSDLLDEKSFVEMGEYKTSGVICGYGTINMRPICLFAQDSSINSGAINEKNCEKICKIIDMAIKNGIPLIGIYDSIGVKISENTGVLVGIRKMLEKLSSASGVIPILSVVLGSAVGIASFAVNFSDFTFMIDKKSKMFVNGPQSITTTTGDMISAEELGGAKAHAEKSGICDVYSKTIEECIGKIKTLLEFLPDNNLADVVIVDRDDVNRICDELENKNLDIDNIIKIVSDDNEFLEIKSEFSKGVITGFARIGGRSLGVIGNRENTLNIDSINKASKFIRFCDSFNLPVVTFINVEGTKVSVEEENSGLSASISKLIYSYTDATVPKISVLVGNAFGGAGLAMGIAADISFAWEDSLISATLPKTAVNILYSEEIANSEEPIKFREEKLKEYLASDVLPTNAVNSLLVDRVISPLETRQRIISALELYISKREHKLPKKHGNLPI